MTATAPGDDVPSGMPERIRALMTERGLTQEEVQTAIGASRGYMSKILSGKRGARISPEYLKSIASVLKTTPGYLRWGKEIDPDAVMTPTAGLSPSLAEIPGYRQAEFEVIRLEPEIPFHIFESARASRLNPPPRHVTTEYLRDLVKFLASHAETVGEAAPASSGAKRKRAR